MKDDDLTITCGLLLCLAVAIAGLYIGAGLASDKDFDPKRAQSVTHSGQVLAID